MGKVLGRPKFGDGDREKLRAALDGGKSWHAVSITTRIPHSNTVKKRAVRSGTNRSAKLQRRSRQQKPAWLRADPSAFTSPRFTFLKPRVPLRARSISKFGTLGPIRASSLFEAPAICWPRLGPSVPSTLVSGRPTALYWPCHCLRWVPLPFVAAGDPTALLAWAGTRYDHRDRSGDHRRQRQIGRGTRAVICIISTEANRWSSISVRDSRGRRREGAIGLSRARRC